MALQQTLRSTLHPAPALPSAESSQLSPMAATGPSTSSVGGLPWASLRLSVSGKEIVDGSGGGGNSGSFVSGGLTPSGRSWVSGVSPGGGSSKIAMRAQRVLQQLYQPSHPMPATATGGGSRKCLARVQSSSLFDDGVMLRGSATPPMPGAHAASPSEGGWAVFSSPPMKFSSSSGLPAYGGPSSPRRGGGRVEEADEEGFDLKKRVEAILHPHQLMISGSVTRGGSSGG